jgi:hypothetical protein
LINNWYLELSRNGKELFQIDTFFQTEIAIERKKGENEVFSLFVLNKEVSGCCCGRILNVFSPK